MRGFAAALVRWAAWGEDSERSDHSPPPVKGNKGSIAASIDAALARSDVIWVIALFREIRIQNFLTRINSGFNSDPDSPVTIFLNTDFLSPSAIEVIVNETRVRKSEDLYALADQLERERGETTKANARRLVKGKNVCDGFEGRSLGCTIRWPTVEEFLDGREGNIKQLDKAWNEGRIRVFSIVAPGGGSENRRL